MEKFEAEDLCTIKKGMGRCYRSKWMAGAHYRAGPSSLAPWSLNCNVHTNHLGGLLKCKFGFLLVLRVSLHSQFPANARWGWGSSPRSKGLGDRWPKPERGSDNGNPEEKTWLRSSQEVEMTRLGDWLGKEETFMMTPRFLGLDNRAVHSAINGVLGK